MSGQDGGPAFPRSAGWNGLSNYEEHASNEEQSGMTLRDYFAGQALVGLFAESAHPGSEGWNTHGAPETPARLAYRLADAMLAERER